jgi:BirA family biotin operon repressor/biotin-[acetyl-CoA-carboxylase] ligase
MDEIGIAACLKGLGIPAVRYFKSTGSTNDIGLDWLKEGAADYSLVVADQQTSGRGRMQRKWITKAGSALACSILFHATPEELSNFHHFSILGGISVCDFLENGYNIHATIKWPNDVLINRKKVCGILSETIWTEGRLDGLVLGIGVNVLKESTPDNEPSQLPTTSIEDETGNDVDRMDVLVGIMEKLLYWRPKLAKQEFMEYWQAHLAFRNEVIQVEQEGRPTVVGLCTRVTSAGELEVLAEDGRKHLFVSGDVHVRAHHERPEVEG